MEGNFCESLNAFKHDLQANSEVLIYWLRNMVSGGNSKCPLCAPASPHAYQVQTRTVAALAK